MVYIILLNWNGWRDTIHCLESIFRSDYSRYRVIVCDNASSDDSMEKIKAWADGNNNSNDTLNTTLNPLILPPVKKPLPYIELHKDHIDKKDDPDNLTTPLVLIQNGSNNGYSAGNNPGIRFALNNHAEYIWLLNNDTVIKTDTIAQLVEHMKKNPGTGLLGTAIYFAANPSELQTMGGGMINSFTGLDRFAHSSTGLDYVAGTSLFIRREVLEQVGLLDESFFFYWEDVDFSRRALKKGWKLSVAENAVVYHKFSASVGSSSLKSDLFKVESLTRYFKKHQKIRWVLPVTVTITGMIVKRLIRKQCDRVLPILKVAVKAAVSGLH